MLSEASKGVLLKSLAGLSLVGGVGLWVLDEHVNVDMMQRAGAQGAGAVGTLEPVIDPSGEPVQLAQTVRGKVRLKPVQVNPRIQDNETEVGEQPLIPLQPREEPKTLDFPEFQVGDPAENEVEPSVERDPLPSNVRERSLEELIQEIRATRAKREEQAAQQALKEREPQPEDELTPEKPLSLGPSRLESKRPVVDVPDPIKLPNEREMKCNQELNIYEAQLVARERSLERAYRALQDEKKRILQMKALVEEQWDEAQDTYDVAANLMERSEDVCVGPPPGPDAPPEPIELGLDQVDPEVRVNQVVQIVKSMKPKAAARVIQRWDSPLAATALKRLSPRVSSKILAELPKEIAQKLTTGFVRGEEHTYAKPAE